jgi:hypothetical protein
MAAGKTMFITTSANLGIPYFSAAARLCFDEEARCPCVREHG